MNIIWTNDALMRQYQIILYLHKEYGVQSVKKFKKLITDLENYLEMSPAIGIIEPTLEDKSIEYRSLPVGDKHNRVIYYIDNEDIVIVDLWDMRQDTDNLTIRVK